MGRRQPFGIVEHGRQPGVRRRRLEQYCEHLFDSSERYRHVGRKAGIKGENREKEHRALMEAVVARDADAAARLITAHFERTAELVRQVLRDRAR